jgi:general secretion pathway protein N
MNRDLGTWITLILGGVCGLLALVAGLQALGVGAGVSPLPDEPKALEDDLQQPLQQVEIKLPDFAQYAEIAQRPIFNADRKPRPIEATATAGAEAAPPPVALNITLLGVLVEGDKKVAIFRDNTKSTTLRAKIGMPLPGELASWTLQELEPRRAVFDGGAQQGTAEVKLDVAKAPTGAPPPAPMQSTTQAVPPPVPPPGQPPPQPGQPVQPGQMSPEEAARQAEVQRIIEQRRAQMRAEAEKMSQQQGQQ